MFAATMMAAVVACCTASAAQAADGDLFVDACMSRVAFAGCPAGLPANPIGIAASPEGNQLYVGVGVAGAFTGLQIFDIDSQSGAVTPRPGERGCFVATAATAACIKLPALDDRDVAYDMAVSPDGQNVYMATLRGALLNFHRDPATGDLGYLNCVGIGNGCKPLTAGLNVDSVAVSPDSQNVYVRGENGLAVLDRNASTGGIDQKATFDGCFSELSPASCTKVDGLAGEGWKLAVSPDGGQVYVISNNPGGVTTFNRSPDGRLKYEQGTCISVSGASGAAAGRCISLGGALAGANVLAVSPNGRGVYVAGAGGLTAFARSDGGTLTRSGCFGAGGCTAVNPSFANVLDIAVTPGSDEVVTAAVSGAVVSFMADSSGALTQRPGSRGCISTAGSGGVCQALPLVADDWMRLAMDPTHLRFFLTSRYGMLASVTRDWAPRCSSFEINTPLNQALAVPLTCADANGDPFTLQKGNAPTAGQLGEISGGAVFYNPFGGFLGTDEFSYRAVTQSRGVGGSFATVKVNVFSQLNRDGIDSDGDGFTANVDCNDSNPAIRPGAKEIKGNNIDENCDSIAEPFPTLSSGVVSKWDVKGTRLTLTTLQVTQQFPKGWKAKIYCKGSKCPFRSKSLKAGKLTKGAATIISSLSKSQRRFRSGQTVEVWVSAPSYNTKVARLALKKGKIPTTQPYCVLPGQTKVQKTCT